MNTRRFVYLAVFAAILAIVLHVTALRQFDRSVLLRAHGITLGDPSGQAQAEANRYYTRGHAALYAGLGLALASVPLLILSARKHEPARRAVVIGLLFCYVVLQFILV